DRHGPQRPPAVFCRLLKLTKNRLGLLDVQIDRRSLHALESTALEARDGLLDGLAGEVVFDPDGARWVIRPAIADGGNRPSRVAGVLRAVGGVGEKPGAHRGV